MHAVTTTDMLLEKVVGLLTEVRDRLPEEKSDTSTKTAKKTAAKKSPAKKAAGKSSTK